MKVEKKELRHLVSKIETLPTLPYVINKLSKMLENPMISAEEVNKIISSDQVLTLKILKLVNSAFYGFPGQISTVTHAIVILGFTAVKSIALSASIFDMFPTDGQSVQFDRRKFWEHAIATAVISKLLARKMDYQEEEEAFVAGLLHDIGKVVLDRYFHDELLRIIEEAKRQDILFIEAEEILMNCNHQNIGNWLGEKWGLPLELCDAITFHHHPDKATHGFKLAVMAHLADIFARTKNIGFGGDNLIPPLCHTGWEALGISENALPLLFDQIDEELNKAEIFFSMISDNKTSIQDSTEKKSR